MTESRFLVAQGAFNRFVNTINCRSSMSDFMNALPKLLEQKEVIREALAIAETIRKASHDD